MEKYFGLEAFMKLNGIEANTSTAVLVTTAHWALCSRGLLCVGSGETFSDTQENRSEILPDGWNREKCVYTLRYTDTQGKRYILKAVTADEMTIMSLLAMKDNSSSDLSLANHDYVEEQLKLKVTEVDSLVQQLQDKLLDPLLGKKTDAKVDPEGRKGEPTGGTEQSRVDRGKNTNSLLEEGRRGRVDPGMPGWGGVGAPDIGRSDLDPLGGVMGGGMMMDPRGRGRDMQPRFDPVGPGMIGGMGGMGGGMGGMGGGMGGMGGIGGMGGRRNVGDAMRPPGWDNDMYM